MIQKKKAKKRGFFHFLGFFLIKIIRGLFTQPNRIAVKVPHLNHFLLTVMI
jgi:hypothetical protein